MSDVGNEMDIAIELDGILGDHLLKYGQKCLLSKFKTFHFLAG